jgi:hypothetical protein
MATLTISQSLKSKTETTITMNWSSNTTADYLWYSTDGGTTWTGVDIADGKSGVYAISGLSANKKYNIKTRIRGKTSQAKADSGVLAVTTYAWPHCTDAPDFEVGQTVTLTFYNPLKRTFSFDFIANGRTLTTGAIYGGTSFDLYGEGFENSLYETITTAIQGQYQIVTKYDTHITTVTAGYSISVDNSRPTFTDFAYYDANASVAAITGNNQVFVQGLSAIAVKIPSANRMVANNLATPVGYYAMYGDHSQQIDYIDGDVDRTIITPDAYGTQRVGVRAYDSRGLFTSVYKNVQVIEYKKPVLNVTAQRLNNFESQTTLAVSGTISPVVVSGAEKNAIISLAYICREVGGDVVASGGFNFTTDNGKFTCEDTIKELDNSKEYEFEVAVIDKFNNKTTETATVGVGQAVFFVSSNLKTCLVNGQEVATKENLQTVDDGVPTMAEIFNATHPVGSVFVTNTNTNPANILGRGAWTLIDKEFTPSTANTTDFFNAAELITNSGGYLVRGGHSIRVRQLVTIDVQADDNDLLLGSFIWTQMGIENIAADMIERMSFADGANGGIVYYVANASGNVTVKDVFDAPSTSGKRFYLEFVIVVDHSRMIDNYCNKFYWKRTS